MKSKTETIIGALLNDVEINKNNEIYVLSDDNNLCVKRYNETTGNDLYLNVNFGSMGLKEFINWCNTFSDEEILMININSALNNVKIKKVRL